ncbi:MAG: hypothetical protein ABEK10_00810 [Candidatus Nanosalina sp.]
MKVSKVLKPLFFLFAICSGMLLMAIYSLPASRASSLYLYEFIGVTLALMITTGGVYKMREIT